MRVQSVKLVSLALLSQVCQFRANTGCITLSGELLCIILFQCVRKIIQSSILLRVDLMNSLLSDLSASIHSRVEKGSMPFQKRDALTDAAIILISISPGFGRLDFRCYLEGLVKIVYRSMPLLQSTAFFLCFRQSSLLGVRILLSGWLVL